MKTTTSTFFSTAPKPLPLFNFMVEDQKGREHIVALDDLDEFLFEVSALAKDPQWKFVVAGHCLPPSVPHLVFMDAQSVIDTAIHRFEQIRQAMKN